MNEPVGHAVIDLDALRTNLHVLRGRTDAKIAAIVKANGYGHGIVPVAQTLVEAGIDYLGVAQLHEALELRQTVEHTPILTWIYQPGDDLAEAIDADLDISLGARWALDAALHSARACGKPARIHLETDTGMSRGGFAPEQLEDVVKRIATGVKEGLLEVIGVWSHLARADEPDSGETERQLARFHDHVAVLRQAGVNPPIRHLANTAGLLWHPETHMEMVRPGIGLYGISPEPAVARGPELGLVPVMTLTSTVVAVRDVEEGTGVSYGHTERTTRATRLGTVPLGYADGIPRSASSRAHVTVAGEPARIVGRICMDQVIVELPLGTGVGDDVIFFGADGPSVDDWARAADTIGYEITTRIGRHVPRHYRGTVVH